MDMCRIIHFVEYWHCHSFMQSIKRLHIYIISIELRHNSLYESVLLHMSSSLKKNEKYNCTRTKKKYVLYHKGPPKRSGNVIFPKLLGSSLSNWFTTWLMSLSLTFPISLSFNTIYSDLLRHTPKEAYIKGSED